MAEEQKAVQEQQPKQLTAIEQKAADQGWVPQDEWAGEPDDWRPAREFLDRGELFKKIDEQNRTIKDLKRSQQDFARHYDKVKETEYKRALADLKAQKKEALLEGNADAVIEIDEQIAETRQAQQTAAAQPVIQEPVSNPIFDAWVEKNSWYQNYEEMQAFADRIGTKLGAAGGMGPREILSEVERQVKEKFAHRFQNPKRNAPAAVEGSGSRGAAGSKKDTFELTAEEKRVGERFVRQGVLTWDKYVADLKKVKGVAE